MEWFIDHYVDPEDRDDPDVTPLLARLHDMPPAIFVVGTLDPLLDDSLFMAARWEAAGHETELHVFPGGPARVRQLPNAGGDGRDESGEQFPERGAGVGAICEKAEVIDSGQDAARTNSISAITPIPSNKSKPFRRLMYVALFRLWRFRLTSSWHARSFA